MKRLLNIHTPWSLLRRPLKTVTRSQTCTSYLQSWPKKPNFWKWLLGEILRPQLSLPTDPKVSFLPQRPSSDPALHPALCPSLTLTALRGQPRYFVAWSQFGFVCHFLKIRFRGKRTTGLRLCSFTAACCAVANFNRLLTHQVHFTGLKWHLSGFSTLKLFFFPL